MSLVKALFVTKEFSKALDFPASIFRDHDYS